MTTIEAAALLGLTRQHVAHLAKTGAIKAQRIGRDWHLDRASVEQFKHTPRRTPGRPVRRKEGE